MPAPKYNPFRPGSIVHPGMFAGRFDELEVLERALYQTQNGNANHFLIHGERGIGKSSLLMLVDHYASAGTESAILKQKFKFLTISVELEPADEYADLISKIARELHRRIEKNEAVKQKLMTLWDFVSKWEVMGVKYNRESTPPVAMLEELSDKICAIAAELGKDNCGIYIFIDEADKPVDGGGLGELVKVFTERLSKRGATNVGLGIIGISNVIEKMKKSHESSVRILTPVFLRPLNEIDRKRVVHRGLEEANRKNNIATTITDGALDSISKYSEGYPYFIQQYAYSSFEHDKDNVIDENDVKEALTKENGALQLLGQRYFENMYSDEIRSDDYRTVLQVLAKHMPHEVTRKQLIDESKLKTHTVRNAISALKKKGLITPASGRDGVFKLPSMSFAAWIQAFKVSS